MSLDTVSLSDIGQSLVAIETEIAANNASIRYYASEQALLLNKNDALRKLAETLLRNAIPLTLGFSPNERT